MQILQSLLAVLLTPEVLAILGPLVVGLVLKILRGIWKEKAADREKLVSFGIEIAYACVAEVAKRTQNKVDDKVAMGLDYLRKWLNANGEELRPVDEEKAKLLFQAMHAKELQMAGK